MVTLTVIIIVLLAVLLVIRLLNGKPVENLFPNRPMKTGVQVHVFIGSKYNRSAEISRVTSDTLYIYGKLPLPLGYRGRFYATGLLGDRKRVYYLGNRNYFYLVHLAEIARRIFNIVDSPYNLVPDLPDEIGNEFQDEKGEEEDEQV